MDMTWNIWNRPSRSFMVDMGISSNIMKYPSPKCYMAFWDMTIYNDTLNSSDITPICELITIHSWTCPVYGPFEFRTSLGTSILPFVNNFRIFDKDFLILQIIFLYEIYFLILDIDFLILEIPFPILENSKNVKYITNSFSYIRKS